MLREDLEVTTPIELNGKLDAIGVPSLEGGLLREDLEVTTPLLAGIEIELNDLMLAASNERGGIEAGKSRIRSRRLEKVMCSSCMYHARLTKPQPTSGNPIKEITHSRRPRHSQQM